MKKPWVGSGPIFFNPGFIVHNFESGNETRFFFLVFNEANAESIVSPQSTTTHGLVHDD